jgi:hypothetical protein
LTGTFAGCGVTVIVASPLAAGAGSLLELWQAVFIKASASNASAVRLQIVEIMESC